MGFDVVDDGVDVNVICFVYGFVVFGLEEWWGEDVIKFVLCIYLKVVEW